MEEKIILERKFNKDNNSIYYDLKSIENREEMKEEGHFIKLMILIKKIILCSNDSFLKNSLNQVGKMIIDLTLNNVVYFIVLNPLIDFLIAISDKKFKEYLYMEPAPFWKRFILFNIPKLIMYFLFNVRKFYTKNLKIRKLMNLLNEKYIYQYNNDKNGFICKIDYFDYDIEFYNKNNFFINNSINQLNNFYFNSKELLSKEDFYENVIVYSGDNDKNFNYKMVNQKEYEIIKKFFLFLEQIKQNIKKENKTYKSFFEMGNYLIDISANKRHLLSGIILKLFLFFSEEFYNEKIYLKQKMDLINNQKELLNKQYLNDGYYLEINKDIFILFRVKEKYSSFDEYKVFISKEAGKFIDILD